MISRICQFFFLGTFAGILILFLFYKTILPWYAEQLYVNNATKGADAIVLLGGGPLTRVDKVLDLYRDAYAPLVLITDLSEQPSRHYPEIIKTQEELSKAVFEREGVRYSQVQNNKGGATSTFDEAWDVARFCRENGFNRIIIVTDAFHSARATYAFQKVFKKSAIPTIVETAAAQSIEKIKENWWKREKSLVTYFLEGLKFIYYRLNDRNFAYIEES